MNFHSFHRDLRPLLVFSNFDIKKLDPSFNEVNLTNWQNSEYITKLAKGYYTFADINPVSELLYFAANKIIDPSYVSCESALAYYGILKMEYSITSVCSIRTYSYKSDYGGFKYHFSRPEYMFGYNFIKFNQHTFKIATPEKAIVDFFNYNPQYNTRAKIRALEFDKVILRQLDFKSKLKSISYSYNNQFLDRRIRNFMNLFL